MSRGRNPGAARQHPGVLSLWKPVGPTSHDLVAYVRGLLPRGAKVGHAGTLDPFAEGVLPICVGAATRLADRIGAGTKTYLAEARLDVLTDTLDRTGRTESTFAPSAPPGRDRLETVLAGFVGRSPQVPPRYSARRVDGRRGYELARSGIEVVPEAREIVVHAIGLVEYHWPTVRFRVVCGRGTYIRSLARDLGAALGVGGILESLVRERVGTLDRTRSRTPFDLLAPGAVEAAFLPVPELLPELGVVQVVPAARDRLLCGHAPGPEDYRLEREARDDEAYLVTDGVPGFPLALAHRQPDGRLAGLKVLADRRPA